MANDTLRSLFANRIERRIEEVIKVDQTATDILVDELDEYVVTESIRGHFDAILEAYAETPNKPHEGIAVWVSGFFGSGKSSFAKYLGLALANRDLDGKGAAALLGQRMASKKSQVLLSTIAAKIPTHAVIFDVSTDRGIRSGSQTLTEIMYRLFLKSLGYAADLDLSELEIALEGDGTLDAFKACYEKTYGKPWDQRKALLATAVGEASRVMHELDSATYPSADSWKSSGMLRADITPGKLAERCKQLMERRAPGKSLVFVIDEVGQFVARDVQKMLDLQAVVQQLAVHGRGSMWLVVTSQEKLNELVGGIDDKRVELSRLMDRFPLQVHLEPSDISEVTSKRVLSKNAAAEKVLRELFAAHRGRLTGNTRLSAGIRLPELETGNFVELYPLLPYQVELIINVVSGLRMAGGGSKHVGGANRTIIKLAQQLLVHPKTRLADAPLGRLATIDQIYDLVAGNIPSEIRSKIDSIAEHTEHALAQSVAKAICLLQYTKSIHRTAENLAAVLHPGVDADSRLAEVKAALDELEKRGKVRQGDDGYRIPTPAEDDWETQRVGLQPRDADASRIFQELVVEFWKPQPSHSFLDTKLFKAGLTFNEHVLVEGDIPVHLQLAQPGADLQQRCEEARSRSQTEPTRVFWVAATSDAIDRHMVEVYRSDQMMARKERSARSRDETALVGEEKLRRRRHQDELKRLLRQACLAGSIYFRGNDRSPDESTPEVAKAAVRVLAEALPEVFDRFSEAAAKVSQKELDALLTNDNLRGLPSVFMELKLIRDEAGKPVLVTDKGPLAEMLSFVSDRASYGEAPSGKTLIDHYGREPFGWSLDAVRLFATCLLRAGKVEMTHKGQVIESALSVDAHEPLTKNNQFRAASFRPRSSDCSFEDVVRANDALKTVFGIEAEVLEEARVAEDILGKLRAEERRLHAVHEILVRQHLPGEEVLDEALGAISSAQQRRSCQVIKDFTAAHMELKEAIRRAAELEQAMTEPRLMDLERARRVLAEQWAFLQHEDDLDTGIEKQAQKLTDLLARETFFNSLPEIDQTARSIEDAYQGLHQAAVAARADAYERALVSLRSTPGWEKLSEEQRQRVAGPLEACARREGCQALGIPLLRSDLQACTGRLNQAVEQLLNLAEDRPVQTVAAGSYFRGGIESEEQLEAALQGLREECLELLGQGKKVLVQ